MSVEPAETFVSRQVPEFLRLPACSTLPEASRNPGFSKAGAPVLHGANDIALCIKSTKNHENKFPCDVLCSFSFGSPYYFWVWAT